MEAGIVCSEKYNLQQSGSTNLPGDGDERTRKRTLATLGDGITLGRMRSVNSVL